MTEKKAKKLAEEFEKFSDKEEEKPDDVYDEESRQEMLEGDEISATEEGFMRGWDGTLEGGKKQKRDSAHKDETSVELAKEQYTED